MILSTTDRILDGIQRREKLPSLIPAYLYIFTCSQNSLYLCSIFRFFPFPPRDFFPGNPRTRSQTLSISRETSARATSYVTPVYVTGEPRNAVEGAGWGQWTRGGELGEGGSARRAARWGQRCLRAVASSDDVLVAWWE